MARDGQEARRPRGIIFDLDGTLADSLEDIAAAVNRTLARHAFPQHPVSAYRTFVGEGVRKLVERALPPGTEHLRDAFLAAYQADYAEHLLDATRLFPGEVARFTVVAGHTRRVVAVKLGERPPAG